MATDAMTLKSILMPVMTTLILAACGKPTPPPPDTIESLVANPERLRELRVQCKLDRNWVGDATCNAVAEATHRRFLASGGPKYTPKD